MTGAKAFFVSTIVLVIFLGCSIAGNFLTTLAVIKMTQQLAIADKPEAAGLLTDKAGHMLATRDEPTTSIDVQGIRPDHPSDLLRAVRFLNFTLPIESSPTMVHNLVLDVHSFTQRTCAPGASACDAADASVTFHAMDCDVTYFYASAADATIEYAFSSARGACLEALEQAGPVNDDALSRKLAATQEAHPLRHLVAKHGRRTGLWTYCLVNPLTCRAIIGMAWEIGSNLLSTSPPARPRGQQSSLN